jgi:hypothetical protein
LLDRVPGNFHIQARSPHPDLVPHLTNVSHVIHSLSFGEPIVKSLLHRGVSSGKFLVADDLQYKMTSMDGNAYITYDLHEAYHHYLKVITTNVPGRTMVNRELKAYQIIQNSQLSIYRPDVVPEAKVMSLLRLILSLDVLDVNKVSNADFDFSLFMIYPQLPYITKE